MDLCAWARGNLFALARGRTAALHPNRLCLVIMIVAKHFDFAVWDQYMLILAVYFGVYYAMPHSQTSYTSKPDTLSKKDL